MVSIDIMGKTYEVPDDLTILQALWYVGHKTIRGVGCLGGFCGACSTVYRLPDEGYKLHVGLACQTNVIDGMSLAQIPFFPSKDTTIYAETVKNEEELLLEVYPDTQKCISCGVCNRVCPQNLNVMGYVLKANNGEFQTTVNWSFDCINCGLCAMKCPADISPNLIARYVRRQYALLSLQPSRLLATRIEEIRKGKYDDAWRELFADLG